MKSVVEKHEFEMEYDGNVFITKIVIKKNEKIHEKLNKIASENEVSSNVYQKIKKRY